MTQSQRRWTVGFLLIGLIVLLAALVSNPSGPRNNQLERIQADTVLRVGTVNSPVTYYIGPDHLPHGFEYELAKAFADDLGVHLDIVLAPTYAQLFELLESNQVDFLAAAVTATDKRRERLEFGPPYQYVTQQVVYRTGTSKPRSPADLTGANIHVVDGSSYQATAESLAKQQPDVSVTNRRDQIETLFAEVSSREIDYTIADSNIVEVHRRFFPLIERAFSLTEPEPVAWAFRRGDHSLLDAAWEFLTEFDELGNLDHLLSQHYDHLPEYDRVNTHYFLRHLQSRLPRYQTWFREAGEATDIDWRLLAAVGYQESHWRPTATSPTGVQGLMMLTQATAGDLDVEDRLDPLQSISGGARYLRDIMNRLPQRITPPDRTWFALAAYNVGFGHLEDARVLTERQGGNPDRWADVVKRLPLLSDPRYYETTKHGRARGQEPVTYVRNIRSYYDILVWYSNRNRSALMANAGAAS